MREIGLRGINFDALMLLGGILLWRTASIPRVLMKRAEFFLRPSIVEKERRTPSQSVARGTYNRARWTCHQVELEFRVCLLSFFCVFFSAVSSTVFNAHGKTGRRGDLDEGGAQHPRGLFFEQLGLGGGGGVCGGRRLGDSDRCV